MRAIICAVLITLAMPLHAATYGEGLATYNRGDFLNAKRIIEPLAESGDTNAQYLFGRMYARGDGVLQDFVEGHKWLNLAASRGSRDARGERDRIAQRMTSSQLAQAQQAARAWRPKAQPQVASSTSSSRSSGVSSSGSRTSSSASAPQAAGPNTGNLTKDVQIMLTELGYDPGPADGLMGRRTRAAIRTYQLHSDLPVTGAPSQSLRSALATDLGYEAPKDDPVAAAIRVQPAASSSSSITTSSDRASAGSTSSNSSSFGGQSSSQQSSSMQASSSTQGRSTSSTTSSGQTMSKAPIYVQEAQTSRRIGRPSANPAIVQLKQLINRADSNRQADRRLLEDLRQIVRKYDWPWQRIIVEDAFSDGEFRRNPAWQVLQGDFWVGRNEGLRTNVAVRRQRNNQQDLGVALLGALLGQQQSQRQDGPATIALPARIDNAFHLEATLMSASTEGLLELGVYRGENDSRGLRLSYRPGQRRSLELTRMRGGEKIFIASYDRPLTLKKGRRHLLTWTRRPDASMSIKLDDQELIRTSPSSRRGKGRDFDGFFLANKGGNYALSSIKILGE